MGLRSGEGPVNIAEGNIDKQLYTYTGEPIPGGQNAQIPKGKAIELSNMGSGGGDSGSKGQVV